MAETGADRLCYSAPAFSRRLLLQLAGLLAAPGDAFAHEAKQSLRADMYVALIRRACPGFLHATNYKPRPMWRGGDGVGIRAPPFDLLDENVYGEAGVRFFALLESDTSTIGVRPSTAHIATGDILDAAVWGEPTSVWPIGDTFEYMWWDSSRLIYDERTDAGLTSMQDVLAQKGQPKVSEGLEDALEAGAEVMFKMTNRGFISVDEQTTRDVLQRFSDSS